MKDAVNELFRQVAARVTTALTNFLPGFLALLAILILAIVAALILRVIVRRSLERIHFDSRMDQWGLSAVAEWSPEQSPARLVARGAFLSVLVVGALIGLSALDEGLPSVLIVQLFNYLPHVAAAAVILFVGVVVSRVLARSVLINAVNMQIQSARLLSVGVKWLVIVLTLAMALDHLRIGGVVVQLSFAILFGGIVLALALAVGLGSREMVSRTWERQEDKIERSAEEHFHHL
jgi:hypothetical protein